MRKKVFADSWYWIALTNSRDRNHKAARELSADEKLTWYTSEAVLTEFLNTFAGMGAYWRRKAALFVGEILRDVVVVEGGAYFREAVERYAKYGERPGASPTAPASRLWTRTGSSMRPPATIISRRLATRLSPGRLDCG